MMNRSIIFFILLAIAFSCKEKAPQPQARPQYKYTFTPEERAFFPYKGHDTITFDSPDHQSYAKFVSKTIDSQMVFSSDDGDGWPKGDYYLEHRYLEFDQIGGTAIIDFTFEKDKSNTAIMKVGINTYDFSNNPLGFDKAFGYSATKSINGQTFKDVYKIYAGHDSIPYIYYTPKEGLVHFYKVNGQTGTLAK